MSGSQDDLVNRLALTHLANQDPMLSIAHLVASLAPIFMGSNAPVASAPNSVRGPAPTNNIPLPYPDNGFNDMLQQLIESLSPEQRYSKETTERFTAARQAMTGANMNTMGLTRIPGVTDSAGTLGYGGVLNSRDPTLAAADYPGF
jgi:hypothetical protein